MTESEKNRWVDEVANSLEGIQRAEAPPMLFQEVMSRIKKGRLEVLPGRVVWLAAASLLLIISANVLLLTSSSKNASQKDPLQAVVNDYQLNHNNPLYSL